MPPRSVPFRWIFPFGQLALSWFITSVVYVFPSGRFFKRNIFHAVFMLNLPSGLLILPIAIFRPDHADWHPAVVEGFVWRAVTWPVVGIVFWWIAGRAVEALASLEHRQLSPRITLAETIPAFLIMAGGALVSVGLLIGERTGVYTDFDTAMFAIAGGLWAFLGGLTVVAYIRQWRLRRQSQTGQVPSPQGGTV
jgi:hypothetical protein